LDHWELEVVRSGEAFPRIPVSRPEGAGTQALFFMRNIIERSWQTTRGCEKHLRADT